MDNEEILKGRMLFALARKRKWGESHTAYENMIRSLRAESFGKDMMKVINKLAEELLKEGLVTKKPTHYGLQVSLNPNQAQEIKKRIKEVLGFDI